MCRSTEISRSAPAALNRSAIRRAETGFAAAMLLVLAGIAVERCDHRDALGGRALERVDHDQLLHDPGVDRRGVALQDEGIATAHRFLEPHEDLAVGEVIGADRAEVDTELLGDLLASSGWDRPDSSTRRLFGGTVRLLTGIPPAVARPAPLEPMMSRLADDPPTLRYCVAVHARPPWRRAEHHR